MTKVNPKVGDVKHPERLVADITEMGHGHETPDTFPRDNWAASPTIRKVSTPTQTPGTGSASSSTTNGKAINLEAGLPQGDEKAKAVRHMFDTISPRYDFVNRVMTFGLDVAWRKRTLKALGLPAGSVVLDLAAGTGDFCRELENKGLLPIGMDLSFGMLDNARTRAPLVQSDAQRLPIADHGVDGVTCGFALRNFTDLGAFFDELGRVVRPGGRIALLDACSPEQKLLKFGHGVYFGKVVPLIGGLLSDKTAYAYLPKSLAYLPPAGEMLERLRSAGFSGVQRHLLTGGAAQLILGTRQG